MAEMLVVAANRTHPDATIDRIGSYKRGMIVVVQPDGFAWGADETPYGKTPAQRKFVLVKVPLIPVAKLERYVEPELSILDGKTIDRRRKWIMRWPDLPQRARDRLVDDGELIIRATELYTGPFDYTWSQVRTFFRNQVTAVDETDSLVLET